MLIQKSNEKMLFLFSKTFKSSHVQKSENGVLFLSLRHDVLGKETIQSVLPRGGHQDVQSELFPSMSSANPFHQPQSAHSLTSWFNLGFWLFRKNPNKNKTHTSTNNLHKLS